MGVSQQILNSIVADVFDWATKAGTLPMQGLMLLSVIVLGVVIRHLHQANQKTIQEFIVRIDAKDTSMTKERLERISMLMDLVKENVDTNGKVAHAVENNTEATAELKECMKEQTNIMKQQLEMYQKTVGRR